MSDWKFYRAGFQASHFIMVAGQVLFGCGVE